MLWAQHDVTDCLFNSRSWAEGVLSGGDLAGVLDDVSAQGDPEEDLVVIVLEEAPTEDVLN